MPLSINNTKLGLVIKVDSLLEPLTAVKDPILNLPPESDEQILALAKQGYFALPTNAEISYA